MTAVGLGQQGSQAVGSGLKSIVPYIFMIYPTFGDNRN